MEHIYFQVVDTSKNSDSIEYAFFGEAPINRDLAKWITHIAKRNRSSVDDIRLFVFESKKAWDKAILWWISGIKTQK